MEIRKLTKKEISLTYSCEKPEAKARGLIGYVRGDFGTNGNEFYTTWWPFNDELKTMYFKNDLKILFDTLRGKNYFLSDRDSLLEFCESGTPMKYEDPKYCGIRVNTHDYSFLFRLYPYKGDYNFYCYCYKRELLDVFMDFF